MSEGSSQTSAVHSPLSIEEASKRLFEHKSLWDLWLASLLIGLDWWHIAISFAAGFAILVGAIALPIPIGDVASNVRQLANDGLTFATTVLGFLIAGFTVFATITKPEIFALMARRLEANNVTHLQKVFFLFLQLFAHYCVFCLVCIVVKLSAAPGAIGVALMHSAYPELKLIVGSIVWAALSGWLVYMLVQLPVFIFNIYSMQLVVIDFAMRQQGERKTGE